jgi:recombinational DNA repair protein (RecF pathway)
MNQVEGILINKYPYQDKHLIGHLLLRNGMKLTVMFFGGQGGGKKSKSSILQLGYLFKVTLSQARKTSFEMLNAKEYSEKWFHKQLATHPRAFYLLCFYCEFIEKFSPRVSEHGDLDLSDEVHGGLFRLLSNGIFQLEKAVTAKNYNHELALFTFLAKALVELGIFPRTEACSISGSKITASSDIVLISESGGFAFKSMTSPEQQRQNQDGRGRVTRHGITEVAASKYGDIESIEGLNINCCKDLLEYICFQQNISVRDFKTSSMIL